MAVLVQVITTISVFVSATSSRNVYAASTGGTPMDLNDTLCNRKWMNTSPAAPPLVLAKSPASVKVTTTPFTPVEVNTADFQEVDVPDYQREVDVPDYQREVDAPDYQREVDAPDYQREVDAPDYQREVDVPDYHKEVDVPDYQREVDVPDYHKEVDVPDYQREVDVPDYQREVDVPDYHKEVDVPDYQREVDVPNYQREVDAPDYQREVDVPDYKREVDAPDYQREVDVPDYHKEVDVPDYQRVVDVPNYQEQVDSIAPGQVTPRSGRSGRISTRADQLFKCFCESQEVLTKSGCKPFPSGTFIHLGKPSNYQEIKSVADLDVVTQDVHCQVQDGHRQMNFTKGQFVWRSRGDIVLGAAAGYLSGLRIENYCITHQLDDQGDLTWMLKACISPPSVPRCCPPGQALKQDACHPAPTPDLFTPDISADKFTDKKEWPLIKNHLNQINCAEKPLRSIPLTSKESYLVSLPTGLMYFWNQSEYIDEAKYTFSPKFCVDARQNLDGSVRYTANLCFSDPAKYHQEKCESSICVRKCCPRGEIFDVSLNRCIAFPDATFKPAFTTTPFQYKTITGLPLCKSKRRLEGLSLTEKGYLTMEDRTVPPTDYCVDQFSDGKGKVDSSAVVCELKPTTWKKNRLLVFRICYIISLVFLFLTVLCHCTVPVLLQNSGWYQLCHVLSLMVAFSSILIQQIGEKMDKSSCVTLGLVMQFGFLAAFFWLSVLCFEVWRKIRSLNRLIIPTDMPCWLYPLYAFGGPFSIGVITLGMEVLAPDGEAGVIKPHFISGLCWLKCNDIGLLLYFYGPVAFMFSCNIAFIVLTYWNYKNIEKNSRKLREFARQKPNPTNDPVLYAAFEQRHPRRNYVSDFKQQFCLLVLMSSCWVCEVLSWKIPPPELWAFTDVLNALQGFFVFIILMANRNKRRHLKKAFPRLFTAAKFFKLGYQKVTSFILCRDIHGKCHLPADGVSSRVRRTLPRFLTKLPSSSASFPVTSPKPKVQKCCSFSDSECSTNSFSSQLTLLSISECDTSC